MGHHKLGAESMFKRGGKPGQEKKKEVDREKGSVENEKEVINEITSSLIQLYPI